MSRLRLLLLSLIHFRKANLAVVVGTAIATAVLAGALMVGDSVRGSLRQLAVQRLGPVDFALAAPRLFPQDLAERLRQSPRFSEHFQDVAAGLTLRGGAVNETSDTRTAGVQIAALDRWITPPPGSAILNGELAATLQAAANTPLLFNLPLLDETPRDATLAQRGRNEVTSGTRATVGEIATEPGMPSMFTLAGGQRTPRNAWLNLRDLQAALDQPGHANLLLVQGKPGQADSAAADLLNSILRENTRLADFGLSFSKSTDGAEAVLSSSTTFISTPVERAARQAAEELKIPLRRVMVYLVNKAEILAPAGQKPKIVYYAIAAGVDPLDPAAPPLADDEIALNEWTAEQLEAKVGDRIRLNYYQRQANGDLLEVGSDRPGVDLTFRVARILPMSGLGADKTLTPVYKGLTDAGTIADWEPPAGLVIDKKLVTPDDERYWEHHKAAPKLFVSLETARKLWGGTYGDVNSLRVPAADAERFAAALRRHLDPADLGLAFQPVRQQQLAAASGTTEFSGLFIGFSFFLICAAVLLIAMLFRLGIEQRVRQFGLLSAVGFTPASVRNLALGEGLLLAIVGGMLGALAAVGYTALMIAGLRTWWFDAVGTTAMRLHVQPLTLLLGFLLSVAIAMLAILWATWQLGRSQPISLLAGAISRALSPRSTRESTTLLWASMLLTALGAVAVLALGATGRMPMQNAFMAGGALLLLASLLFISGQLRPPRRQSMGVRLTLLRLAVRNAARHRGRSLLAVGLIAFASFVLVTVASMRQAPPADTHEKHSGAGGYALILHADLPLLGDLNTPNGRELLGVLDEDSPLWNQARFMPLRAWQGQDISCLNLTQASQPTILAVPDALVQRGAFTFARKPAGVDNPWQLLNLHEDDPHEIPVIADEETARWILKLNLNDTFPLTDQLGRPRKLKLVATLAHSIFQSELLMSEENFRRLFPTQSGYSTVLIDAPAGNLPDLTKLLSHELADFSVVIEPTAQRLHRYQQVANTYLSTFQVLGSLGLMLGTIGLAVVLLRSLIERRSELALLAAIGFRPADRLRLVMVENAFLLAAGLLAGAFCALVGILPTILSSARPVNLTQLGLTLGLVFATGLLVLAISVWFGARRLKVADLRAE